MPTFELTAVVSVDVEMLIDAPSVEAAQSILNDKLAMSATLIDADDINFTICDDSISDVSNLTASPADV